jgi:hypothetical protein
MEKGEDTVSIDQLKLAFSISDNVVDQANDEKVPPSILKQTNFDPHNQVTLIKQTGKQILSLIPCCNVVFDHPLQHSTHPPQQTTQASRQVVHEY